jgi:hypothetical protein
MKSLEPYQKKLGTDTWHYTKRCFLALFEMMAKHIILMKDSFIAEIFQFLSHCESELFPYLNSIKIIPKEFLNNHFNIFFSLWQRSQSHN